jgi:hypothetical protein
MINIFIALEQYMGVTPSFNETNRISGNFYNPAPFSIYLGALLPFAIFKLRTAHSFLEKSTTFLIIAVSLWIIYELNSRGVWVALMILLIINISNIIPNTKFLLKILTLSVIIIFSVPLLIYLYTLRPDSAQGRILIWLSSLTMSIENPFGVGIGLLQAKYLEYQSTILALSKSEKFNLLAGDTIYAFNDILQISSERGIIGISIFLFIIYNLITSRRQIKNNIFELNPFKSSILLILICGITSYPLTMLPIAILFWLNTAFIASYNYNKKKYKIKLKYLLSLTLFIGAFYIPFNKFHLYYNWSSSIKYEAKLQNTFIQSSNPEFLAAIAEIYLKNHSYNQAIMYLEKSLSLKFDLNNAYKLGNIYEKNGLYTKAITIYKKISTGIPHLITPKYLLSKLYLKNNDILNFLNTAEELINTKPKRNIYEVSKMKNEISNLLDIYTENSKNSHIN